MTPYLPNGEPNPEYYEWADAYLKRISPHRFQTVDPVDLGTFTIKETDNVAKILKAEVIDNTIVITTAGRWIFKAGDHFQVTIEIKEPE